jgi:hypothetical protein
LPSISSQSNFFQDFFEYPAGAFAAQGVATMGIGMVGMAMSLPDLGFQTSGAAPTPGGSLSVGATGGGGLPSNTGIQTLALSLALVPLGLFAVAVFPPFARFVN